MAAKIVYLLLCSFLRSSGNEVLMNIFIEFQKLSSTFEEIKKANERKHWLLKKE